MSEKINKHFLWELNLYERNGQAYCSSRQVAKEFNRRHDHILRLIGEITAPTSGVSEKFRRRNFVPSASATGNADSICLILNISTRRINAGRKRKNARMRRLKGPLAFIPIKYGGGRKKSLDGNSKAKGLSWYF